MPVQSRRRKKREQKELFVGDTGAGKSKLLSQVAIPHGSYCASVTAAPLEIRYLEPKPGIGFTYRVVFDST